MPKEFKKFGKYAKLKQWPYGIRNAASGLEDDNAGRLVNDGFERSKVESTILHHPKSQVRVVVHGDDAATVTELKKIRSRCLSDMTSMCLASWAAGTVTYEKWSEMDERMEYQATDRHRQTLM